MLIYLAARYSRRLELCHYRTQLEELGHVVTSRWLDGTHEVHDNGRDALPQEHAARFAAEDMADVDAAGVLIAFTEEPCREASRGGRHWEACAAWVGRKPVLVVGPVENIFYALPGIAHYPTFDACKAALPLGHRIAAARLVSGKEAH